VIEYLRVGAPTLWPKPPLDVVNLRNGLLDLASGELRPHDPDFLSPAQIPVVYDPDAGCPAWEKFIAETLPDDCADLPWELAAWLMTPATSIQKAVLLLGEGSNGKSTFLAALTAFLGAENCAAVSLHKLEADRFAAARLVGKLANICPDLPSAHLAGTSAFKAIVGGDRLAAERKYAESFEYEPYARLIFSANSPPMSGDSSHAFFRRWLCVPFARTFEDGRDARPRAALDAELAAAGELSGVLNRALAALAKVQAKGVTETASMREALGEFRSVTDPLSVWLDRETVADPMAVTPKRALLAAFNAYCEKTGRPPMMDRAFGRALKRLRPDLEETRRTIGGRHQNVWLGVAVADDQSGQSGLLQLLTGQEKDDGVGMGRG
jgi:putative DNA primase/helicase